MIVLEGIVVESTYNWYWLVRVGLEPQGLIGRGLIPVHIDNSVVL